MGLAYLSLLLVERGHGVLAFVVAMCLGSLVATATLVVGWSSEPEELERWALLALVAAFGSALPQLFAF